MKPPTVHRLKSHLGTVISEARKAEYDDIILLDQMIAACSAALTELTVLREYAMKREKERRQRMRPDGDS